LTADGVISLDWVPHGQHDLAFGEKIAGNLPLDVGGDLYWRRELRTPLTPVLFAPSRNGGDCKSDRLLAAIPHTGLLPKIGKRASKAAK